MLPDTLSHIGCDWLKFVCGTKISTRTISWCLSSIQNHDCNVGQLTCKTLEFHRSGLYSYQFVTPVISAQIFRQRVLYASTIIQQQQYVKRTWMQFNTLRPRQDGWHFPDDIFTCIFLNEIEWHSIKISLKFVPKIPINNIPALVRIMARRRPGDKPLSEPMMVVLPTNICVTRPQWVKSDIPSSL